MDKAKLDSKFKKRLHRALKDLKPYMPEKVVVFGSLASGKIKKNSDIDLLIIKETKKKRAQRIEEVLKLIYKQKDFGKGAYDVPVEPYIYTPAEIENRLSMGDFFLKEILDTGRIVYEKK